MAARAVSDLVRRLIVIRDTFHELPLPLSTMLLAVAERPGSTCSELGADVGGRRSSYFRHLMRLGDGDHTGPGLKLVKSVPHADGRSHSIYLTAAGERVVEKICGARMAANGARRSARQMHRVTESI